MSKTSYALHVNEDGTPVHEPSPLRFLSVAATVMACVGIVLGAVSLDFNSKLSKRVDDNVGNQAVSEHSVRQASMLQSAISAHPNCGQNVQACVDLMNLTSVLATRNLTSGMFSTRALHTANVQSGLFKANGQFLSGATWMKDANIEMPNDDFSNCAFSHGHTCFMVKGNKMASFSRLGLSNLPAGAINRRDFGSGLDTGFQYGKDGAEFGSAVGAAVGTLAPGVGTAVGGAVGGLAGAAVGFGVGMYEGW
eukprot:m.54830 g.54830  ORF g.54830 m.54830 type:complete len:251 (+) comp13645_c0_seq1:55-807(+)